MIWGDLKIKQMGKILKFTIYLFFIGIAMSLYSCANSIPTADKAHESWAQKHWGNINLSEGRSAYAENCSGCHSLHSPAEHTKGEWVQLFEEMASKAHMTPADSMKVFAYLETYSKDNNFQ